MRARGQRRERALLGARDRADLGRDRGARGARRRGGGARPRDPGAGVSLVEWGRAFFARATPRRPLPLSPSLSPRPPRPSRKRACQVLNAVLLVPVLGFLYALATRALPEEQRVRGRAAALYAAVFGTVVVLSIGSCIASFVL